MDRLGAYLVKRADGASPRKGLFRMRALAPVLFLVLLAACLACNLPENSPSEVVTKCIEALGSGNTRAALEPLVDWQDVLLDDNYISRSVFRNFSDREKGQAVEKYKKMFFELDMPVLRQSTFRIISVGDNRGDGTALIAVVFKGKEGTKKQGREFETLLKMKLDTSRNTWVITGFGDLVRFSLIEGDYNPRHFYLNEPIE